MTQAIAFVGRDTERRRLVAALDDVAQGRGAAVVISGTTGVGKTELARQAMHLAAEAGFLTLYGTSSPLSRDLAYGPVVEAIGRVLRSIGPGDRADLVEDLPVLGRLLDGLGLPPPEPLGDAGLEKSRLFEALLRLLERLSSRAPVAMLFDDLQWFDRSSLEVLAYLMRDLPGLPLLLLGTYREEDRELPQLRQLLSVLRGAGVVEEIDLVGIDDASLSSLAANLLGGDAPAALVDLLHVESRGVPMFARALVEALRENSDLVHRDGRWLLRPERSHALPRVIREAIRDQLDGLSAEDRIVVDAAAVAAGTAPVGDIATITDGSRTAELVHDLEAKGLLIESRGPDARVSFAHPLVLQVAYELVPAAARRRLHARLIEILEERQPRDLDSLAYHYREGSPAIDETRAVQVTLDAARQALDRSADAEALAHLDGISGWTLDDADRLPALQMLGEARFRMGMMASAVEAWQDVLPLVRADPRATAAVHLSIALALSEWASEDSDRHVQAGLAAVADIGPVDESIELRYVSTLNAHRQGSVAGTLAGAVLVSEEAAALSTDRAQALAVAADVTAAIDDGRYVAARQAIERGQEALRRGGPALEMRGYLFTAIVAAVLGDLPALGDANRSCLALVRRAGLPAAQMRLQTSLFIEAFYSGDWERAQEVAVEGEVFAEVTNHVSFGGIASSLGALLLTLRGDLDGARIALAKREVPEAITRAHSFHKTLHWTVAAALALEQGDPRAALAEARHVRGRFILQAFPPWSRSVEGEALARLGREEEALEIARTLARSGSPASYPDAMAERIRGLAEDSAERHRAAVDRLSGASEAFAESGMPFEAARAALESAEASARGALGRADMADRLLETLEAFVTLGAERYAARTRRVLRALSVAIPSETTADDLTRRQVEIGELVAEGRTNAEIATELFISTRTVESHLDHIYTRLGIGSRVQLAMYMKDRDVHART